MSCSVNEEESYRETRGQERSAVVHTYQEIEVELRKAEPKPKK